MTNLFSYEQPLNTEEIEMLSSMDIRLIDEEYKSTENAFECNNGKVTKIVYE